MSASQSSKIDRSVSADAEAVLGVARRAKAAATALALLPRSMKDAALSAMAAAIRADSTRILSANAEDVADGRAAGMTDALVDRLTLTAARVEAMASGLDTLVSLPDPVGEVVRGSVLPNGVRMTQLRVPLGVVAIVYEARPNVTVDAAGIALKSGNAVLLRGSASAYASNRTLVKLLSRAAVDAGLPADVVQLAPGTDRESVKHLMTARGLVDVIIPRGGAGLIQAVVNGSTVPVIETGVGNCHVYIDVDADVEMAVHILVNSKARRPSVCNAAETLLVHRGIAAAAVPVALAALREAGVTVHADQAVQDIAAAAGMTDAVVAAQPDDFDTEFGSLDIAAAVVDDLDAAIAHIAEHGTGHTEAIVTGSLAAAQRFTARG